MKRRMFLLLICIAALLCLPVMAAEGAAPAFSTDLADLNLRSNAGGNYIMTYGQDAGRPSSFLYETENGNLGLVQVGSRKLVAAEFDQELNFRRVCTIELPELHKWGGFLAGEKYNYLFYTTEKTVLRVDQYTKDWQWKNSNSVTPSNTTSMLNNGFSVTEGNGVLHVITTHYMENGHQSNLLLEFHGETLSLLTAKTGVADYHGYTSHSFYPKTVWSGGTLYTAELCDSIPGVGVYLSKYRGSFSSGETRSALLRKSVMRDWGVSGNLIPAFNNGALSAYTYAPMSQMIYDANVYLSYFNGESNYAQSVQVSYDGASTPYVAALNERMGYVMWNPEPRHPNQEREDLYYAVYTLNNGSLSVGPVQRVERTWLSDCEPISWDNTVIWFTMQGELVFNRLDVSGRLHTTAIHSPIPLEEQAPTCTEDGRKAGTVCGVCGEVLSGGEVILAMGHKETVVEAMDPTCTEDGCEAGVKCEVCGEILSGAVIPATGHREKSVERVLPTCTEEGHWSGVVCEVCEEILSGCSTIPAKGHKPKAVAAVAPTCTTDGCEAGTVCGTCGEVLSGNVIPATGHREKAVKAVAPTCTEEGREAGVICEVCDEILSGCDVLKPGGHREEQPEIFDCTKAICCMDCGTELKPAWNVRHNFSQKLDSRLPGCTTEGWVKYGCTGCDVETTEIWEPWGHTWIAGCCAECGLDCAEVVRQGDTLTVTIPKGAYDIVMVLATYDADGRYRGCTVWEWEDDGSMTVPLEQDCGKYCLTFYYYESFTRPRRPALRG